MRVLVLGAAGLAGRAFLRVLPPLGYECIPVTRQNYQQTVGARADVLINANGNSAKYLAERDPVGEIDRTIASVMRSTVDFAVDTYVLLSSADVYPCPDDPRRNSEAAPIDVAQLSVYGLTKHLAECVVRNRQARWVILRLGGLLGPGLRKNPVFDLLTGQSPLRVHPDSAFGYIHTEEVARLTAHLLQAGRTGELLNVAGRGVVSVRELFGWVGRVPTPADEAQPRLHYEINNAKLAALWNIPASAATARDFIETWKREPQP